MNEPLRDELDALIKREEEMLRMAIAALCSTPVELIAWSSADLVFDKSEAARAIAATAIDRARRA